MSKFVTPTGVTEHSIYEDLTVGKPYEVEDDSITDDVGHVWECINERTKQGYFKEVDGGGEDV